MSALPNDLQNIAISVIFLHLELLYSSNSKRMVYLLQTAESDAFDKGAILTLRGFDPWLN